MISSEKYTRCLPHPSDRKYSFQDGSPYQFDRSKKLPLAESKSQLKEQESELFSKLAHSQIKNMISSKVSISKESDAMLKQIIKFDNSPSYFNQKYYENKQQEMSK